jgi:hypothetical protein
MSDSFVFGSAQNSSRARSDYSSLNCVGSGDARSAVQAVLDAGWWIESALRGGRADVMTRGQRPCVIIVLEVQDRTASGKTADRMPQSSSSSMPIPNIATLATDAPTMSR